jgi:hypothetical protein
VSPASGTLAGPKRGTWENENGSKTASNIFSNFFILKDLHAGETFGMSFV